MASDAQQERGKSALFLQSGRKLRLFSTGTEKGGFTGFSGIGRDIGKGKGARIGLVFGARKYRDTGIMRER